MTARAEAAGLTIALSSVDVRIVGLSIFENIPLTNGGTASPPPRFVV